MRISRIYQEGDYHPGLCMALSKAAGHHVSRVLRLQKGAVLHLFNGEGVECEAVITQIEKHQVQVEVTGFVTSAPESKLAITLFQGISKGETMDFSIQKSVELGVHAIAPMITDRSQGPFSTEHLHKKLLHWQGIIISACEQSGRAVLPVLYPPVTFKKIIFTELPGVPILLNPEGSITFKDLPFDTNTVSLFIGPEGGFSDDEIALAAQHKVKNVNCGPRILRTETASLAAMTLLQHCFGDL